ncbi:MAG: DMT family transporter [Alphaproteobacteria bacterium]
MSVRDIALAVFVVALWGLHVVIIRIGALEIPPLLLLGIRYAIVLGAAAFFFQRLAPPKIKAIALYAFPYLVLHLGTIFIGLRYIEAGVGGLILQTEVPFAILLGWIFYREKFGIKTAFGLFLAFLGVLMIIYKPGAPVENFSYFGALTLLASSFFWAVGSLRMRYIDGVDFWSMTFYSHLIALPFIVLFSALFESNHLQELQQANWTTLGFVLFYQTVLMTLCLYWWKGLMVRNHAYKVTIFMLLQPVFSVMCSIIILHETFDLMTIKGGLITLLGVAVVTLRKARKAQNLETEQEKP